MRLNNESILDFTAFYRITTYQDLLLQRLTVELYSGLADIRYLVQDPSFSLLFLQWCSVVVAFSYRYLSQLTSSEQLQVFVYQCLSLLTSHLDAA